MTSMGVIARQNQRSYWINHLHMRDADNGHHFVQRLTEKQTNKS